MKRIFHWLDENLEEFLLVIGLIAMTLITRRNSSRFSSSQ